jgi:hypothetical protein
MTLLRWCLPVRRDSGAGSRMERLSCAGIRWFGQNSCQAKYHGAQRRLTGMHVSIPTIQFVHVMSITPSAILRNKQVSHEQIHSSLHSQRLNLINLWVDLSRNDHSGAVIPTNTQNGSFLEYINAKYMGSDQLFIDILPQLPPSLEHLAIQYCRVPVLQTLTFVASQANQGLMPAMNLMSLRSEVCYPGWMVWLPARGATEVLFEITCQDLQNYLKGRGLHCVLRVIC